MCGAASLWQTVDIGFMSDGESENFGPVRDEKMPWLVGGIHCLNHRLELVLHKSIYWFVCTVNVKHRPTFGFWAKPKKLASIDRPRGSDGWRGPQTRAFQFGPKSFDSIRFSLPNRFFFDSIRFGNLINLPLVHWYSNSKLGVIFMHCVTAFVDVLHSIAFTCVDYGVF